MARPARVAGGAMQARNVAAAYVQVIDKQTDQPIGTVMLSQRINDSRAVVCRNDSRMNTNA